MNGSKQPYNLDNFLETNHNLSSKTAKEVFLAFPTHIQFKNMVNEIAYGRKVSVKTDHNTTIIITYLAKTPSYLTRESYKEYKETPFDDATYLSLLSEFKDEYRQDSGQLILELIGELREANYKLHDNRIAEKVQEAEIFLEGRW